MIYYIMLYYIILNHIIVYYIVLHNNLLYYIILYYIILYYTRSYYIVLYCIILYIYIVLYIYIYIYIVLCIYIYNMYTYILRLDRWTYPIYRSTRSLAWAWTSVTLAPRPHWKPPPGFMVLVKNCEFSMKMVI